MYENEHEPRHEYLSLMCVHMVKTFQIVAPHMRHIVPFFKFKRLKINNVKFISEMRNFFNENVQLDII